VRGQRGARARARGGSAVAPGGFGLTAATGPVAPAGSTWIKLGPLRYRQTGAAVFMPALPGVAGPCTVCSVTPHVRAVDGFRVARALGRADRGAGDRAPARRWRHPHP